MATDPFRSPRLLYRAIESPDDDDFFHALQADPISFSTSTPSLLVPASRKTTSSIREHYTDKSLIAVLICLPTTAENLKLARPDPAPASDTNSNTTTVRDHSPNPGNTPSLVRSPIRTEPLDKGIPVGAMCLSPLHAGERYAHHRSADIGIDIAPKFQRRGYGGEALRWILDWGFRQAGLHRVGIRVLGWNEGALRLYRRVGFVLEGREREALWFGGRWWDDFGLGMLEGEWRGRYGEGSGEEKGKGITEEVLQ